MKKKITSILASILVIATVIPSMALAASNAAILDKLKLSDVKKYDVAFPTKGTKKTERQIIDLLNKIPYKPSGKGNTEYLYYLSFRRPNSKKPGNYESVSVNKQWVKDTDKIFFVYVEHKDLMNLKAGIHCEIQKIDAKNTNIYYWVKGKKTGNHDIYKNKINNNENNNTNVKTADISNYKLYPDATVLGEKCMVYSYDEKVLDETVTFYHYISRTTRQNIKYTYAIFDGINTTINFELKLFDKSDSFFNPPKDIKFTTTMY